MTHDLDPADVRAARLGAQGLTGSFAPGSGADVVRRLLAVQSQEHAHALWSLALRGARPSADDLGRELDEGGFLRTHVLRPTWHLVAPEDLRWLLATTSPRVQIGNAAQARREGLSESDLTHASRVIVSALERADVHLTRTELAAVLTDAGLPSTGLYLVLLVMHAELEGLICSGRMRGKQHTYALMDERVPADAPREADLPELARRFVRGRGPAGVADLCRWASLTKAQATQALADAGGLRTIDVDGTRLWYDPETAVPGEPSGALLLPLYDELPLSYLEQRTPTAPDHPHPAGADQLVGTVVVDGTDVGLWRRVLKATTVQVELRLAPSLATPGRRAVEGAAGELAAFLGRELVLTTTTERGRTLPRRGSRR